MTYEVTDPTVDSQIIQLKDSGANVFFNISTPKFAAQAIRKAADIGWKPAQYLNNVSASVASVMKPAGYENSQGIITAAYLKDPTDKQWDDDAEMKTWRAWMDQVHAAGQPGRRQLRLRLCRRHHDARDPEEVRRHADARERHEAGGELQEVRACPLLLPGITVSTSPTDFYPIQAVQLARFKGESWELFGEVMHAESS